MKKTMKLIASLAVLWIFGSAYVEGDRDTMVGKEAPALQVKGDVELPDLSDLQGKFVILSFWTPTDAMSRMSLKQMKMAVGGMSTDNKEQFDFLSICLDTNEDLYREVVRSDKSAEHSQYLVDPSKASKMIDSYGLNNEMKTLLIGPDGRVMAVNPEPDDLLRLVRKA